jgi:hypothetical protein
VSRQNGLSSSPIRARETGQGTTASATYEYCEAAKPPFTLKSATMFDHEGYLTMWQFNHVAKDSHEAGIGSPQPMRGFRHGPWEPPTWQQTKDALTPMLLA